MLIFPAQRRKRMETTGLIENMLNAGFCRGLQRQGFCGLEQTTTCTAINKCATPRRVPALHDSLHSPPFRFSPAQLLA